LCDDGPCVEDLLEVVEDEQRSTGRQSVLDRRQQRT
jgi:hypothetical protein